MTETSPSDSSENASGSSNTSVDHPILDILARPPIKRARPQLSCTPCRQGKLKCNREHPVCDQCRKRSRESACQYVPPPPRNKQAQNMRGRIRNLESLVVNLMHQKQAQENGGNAEPQGETVIPPTNIMAHMALPPKSSTDAAKPPYDPLNTESFGHLRINNAGNETSYVASSHWTTILHEIGEVKNYFEEEEAGEDQADDGWEEANQRSNITFGASKPVTKKDLLDEMPPKDEVDRLLPLWFNSADPMLYIIHAPTFQEEYKQFWKDPSSLPVMWIALLYGAMALGIILGPRNPGLNAYAAAYDRSSGSAYDRTNNMAGAPSIQTVDKYQTLCSSAIALADISKPQPYTIEALITYGECEFLRRDDHHSKIWLMNAVVVRVALRMGYHRDPSHFKNLSPFQGEMRKRVWHVLNMMDTLVSFAIGLPSMIRRIESDTRPPHNLYDSDFSSAVTELPKERPFSEITPGSYTIAKSRLCSTFAEAAELSQKVVKPKHSDVVALDKCIQKNYALIPDGLRVRPLEECITDPPVLIMSRYNIELLYQKTRIVLHRRYLRAGQTDERYALSRRICTDAAIQVLRHQEVIFQACQPGGQLGKAWWYMSSLSTYDFLLAAMVVCLELSFIQRVESSPEFRDERCPMAPEMFRLLERTYDIWANHPNRLSESVKAAKVLKSMLNKTAGGRGADLQLGDPVPNGLETNIAKSPTYEFSFAENTTSGDLLSTWGASNGYSDSRALNMTDVPQTMDWTMWDSVMQNQKNTIPQQSWSADLNNLDPESWLDSNMDLNNALNFQEQVNIDPMSTAYDFSTGWVNPNTTL